MADDGPMQRLVAGVHHFQSQVFTSQRSLFEHLAQGQDPDTLLITCSDSRINPNLITQTLPGELFLMRNAGNLVPPYGASSGGEGATIEYAVAGLGVQHIIVVGHSQCGAIAALLDLESVKSMPSVRAWLGHAETTRRLVADAYPPDLSPSQRINVATQENVLCQLENLRTHPCVAVAMARGRLHLHAWVYKMAEGEVFAYDPERGQFAPVTEIRRTVTPKPNRTVNVRPI